MVWKEIQVSELELLSLMWASGINTLLGVYDPLAKIPAAKRRVACSSALESVKQKEYLVPFDRYTTQVVLPVVWLLMGCSNADQCMMVEHTGKDGERLMMFSSKMGLRVLTYQEGMYRLQALDSMEEVMERVHWHMLKAAELSDYAVQGSFQVPSQTVRSWRVSVDNRHVSAAVSRMVSIGMPQAWAEHITHALAKPLFRGNVHHYATEASGKELSDTYSLLISRDGVAYEIRNHGELASIVVESARDGVRHLLDRYASHEPMLQKVVP